MVKKPLIAAFVLSTIAAIVFYALTIPRPLGEEAFSGLPPADPANGERLFHAGGCVSCHAAEGAKDDDRLVLAGGAGLVTPFGTFYPPNISQDRAMGIGNWNFSDFANAMKRGVSPDGDHYYPAFPYASYTRMEPGDLGDLFSYMQTLPASAQASRRHDLAFPFNLRRGLGLWKLLHLNDEPVLALDANSSATLERGRYLVEAVAHCGECHTPRDFSGGMNTGQWLAGGPAPEGKGKIPNITPSEDGIGAWSEGDITYSLETGFTPEFDTFGGSMTEVQRNMAQLPASDRKAIAAYLKAIPAR